MRDLKRPAAETVATQQLHLARVAPGPGLQCTPGDDGQPRRPAAQEGRLETPMLVVGGHLSAKQHCDEPLAGSMGVSQRGYFDSRHCWRVISARDRSE